MKNEFKKWWNESYHARLIININYQEKIKVSAFNKISKNRLFCKCLVRTEGSVNAKWISGGTYDFLDSSENDYHFSFWLEHKDDSLFNNIKRILSEMDVKSIISLSDTRIMGIIEDKHPTEQTANELLNTFQEMLVQFQTNFVSSVEENIDEYEKIKYKAPEIPKPRYLRPSYSRRNKISKSRLIAVIIFSVLPIAGIAYL